MNLMTTTALQIARAETAAAPRRGKIVDRDLMFTNLLSSLPLCFNLFAELQADFVLASQVIGDMLGKSVRVTKVELEYSPGRGSREFTGDHSAADAYVEYEVGSGRGFLCIEVKYHEDLIPPRWRDRYRARYSEVAAAMKCFRPRAESVLRKPPLEQLWRNHLLAGSILQHPASVFDEGQFVLLFPAINEACRDAAERYRDQLTDEKTFSVWTLEGFVQALEAQSGQTWATSLRERYLDFGRVDAICQ